MRVGLRACGTGRRRPLRTRHPRGERPHGAALALALALVLSLPGGAQALGLELMPAGGRPAGRAGAVVAGGDSPWALHHNPALLSRLPGNHLVAAGHLHFSRRCMTRVEVVENGADRSAGETFPQVCAQGMAAVPQLAGSFQLGEGLVLGVGVYVPPGDLRNISYGDPDTLTMAHQGETIPTPTRYLLANANLFQATPTVGLAYEPHPAIRLGAAFGWGLTQISFTSAAFASIEDFGIAADARVHAQATDYFVPRITLGAHARPNPDVPFEMGLSFMWQDDIRTSNADLDMSTEIGTIRGEEQLDGVGIHVPRPSRLSFGMRYFQPLAMAADDVGDRLSNERFDLEANVTLLFGENVDAYVASLPEGADFLGLAPLPEEFRLERQWRTQVAVRVGGDYNPIPGRLGLRGGFTFESHGVHRGYEQIDFVPFRRYGVHVGATVRLHRAFDMSVSYAHMFQPSVQVGVEEASIRRAVGGDTTEADADIVNAGTITARFHALMIEAAARF